MHQTFAFTSFLYRSNDYKKTHVFKLLNISIDSWEHCESLCPVTCFYTIHLNCASSDPDNVLGADFFCGMIMNNNRLLAAILHQRFQPNWLHLKAKLDKSRSVITLKISTVCFCFDILFKECGCIIGFITFLTFLPGVVFITGHNCATGWKTTFPPPPSALKVVAQCQNSISFLDTMGTPQM